MSSPVTRLVLASANPDKIAEIAAILGPGFELLPRPTSVPEVVEDGETLEDNARLKAVAICRAVSAAAVADDTGFEVDALGGEPGVRAARYAGEHVTYEDNVAKVLAELERAGAHEPAARRARFRTVALVRYPDGGEVVADGTVEGTIAPAPAGAGRFGYDPIFIPDGSTRTFAAMTAAEKHAISHRGRAFRALAAALAARDR
jgi:XTP/dITP diphosphohydrolase